MILESNINQRKFQLHDDKVKVLKKLLNSSSGFSDCNELLFISDNIHSIDCERIANNIEHSLNGSNNDQVKNLSIVKRLIEFLRESNGITISE